MFLVMIASIALICFSVCVFVALFMEAKLDVSIVRGKDLERLAELEHEQWMNWSLAVADEVSSERRERWKKYWVPYDKLPEDVKEQDREWARKVVGVLRK